jgi:hypothetical protein
MIRHTLISPGMSIRKSADTGEMNHQFRYSENCYIIWCGLSLFGNIWLSFLKEATVH